MTTEIILSELTEVNVKEQNKKFCEEISLSEWSGWVEADDY